MLEIVVLYLLCSANARTAAARGRRPAMFVLITLALWFGLEYAGFALGVASNLGVGAYFMAILFAAAGGFISRRIAQNCREGDYFPGATALPEGSEPLERPCELRVVQARSFAGMGTRFGISLNGERIGELRAGAALLTQTAYKKNMISAFTVFGRGSALIFEVTDGGQAEIVCRAGKFLPDKCTGCFVCGRRD